MTDFSFNSLNTSLTTFPKYIINVLLMSYI